MGTRRKKRDARHTYKKKGGALWTPNKDLTIKRRQQLVNYTSNSTRKSNHARQMLHQYLTNVQEENQHAIITANDVLEAITPNKKPGDLGWYVDYAVRNCENLIIAATYTMMRQKKRLNEEYRLSKQATFLANRAAARTQQAAHIAALSHLSHSSIEPAVRAELNTWNKSALQRELEQQRNIEEAARIFKNKSTIQAEEARIHYELTKQVVEHIEKLDYMIILYKKIQSNSATMGAYYSAEQRERDKASIVLAARERIVRQIPELGGTVFVDRAIPKLMDEMMVLLTRASAAHLKTVMGSALDIAMARQQDLGIQEKQLRLVRLHFDILVGHDPRLRGELAKNPLLDITKYSAVMKKLDENIEEVKKLKRK